MPGGGPATTLMTLGYDPAGRVLTLNAEGPSMDLIEFKS
jgi:hypothetical protein